jgi:hypothetical protein
VLKRVVVALALAGTVMPLAPAHIADAAEAPPRITSDDAFARIQVGIKSIYIRDDHDWIGGNDFTVFARFFACETQETECSDSNPARMLAFYLWQTSGSSGDTVAQNRVLPFRGNGESEQVQIAAGYDASEIAGYPLYEGYHYYVEMLVRPHDQRTRDNWARITLPVASNGEVDYGTKTVRGVGEDDPDHLSDYDVEFDVRKMEHPDLSAIAIQTYDLPGNPLKLVCATIVNVGPVDAGSFEVNFNLDGSIVGSFLAGKLAAGESADACDESNLSAPGDHKLSAFVDQPRGIYEQNDRNNYVERPYTGPPAQPKSTIAELAVPSVVLKNKESNGQFDCDPGKKNDIAITVKNEGAKAAGPFVVRLTIDAGSGGVRDTSLPGLDGLKSQDVLLKDVTFPYGTHELIVFADATNKIPESDRTNNRKLVNVTCNNE